MFAGVTRAAHASLRPQVIHQLLFQRSTGLNEQTSAYGLVGNAHALVVEILSLKPPGDLLGRPIQNQFTRNEVTQLAVRGKQTAFRPQRCVPCLLLRIIGAIGRSAPMARYFPTHRGSSSMEATVALSNRGTGHHP